jgi:hypothetical protein
MGLRSTTFAGLAAACAAPLYAACVVAAAGAGAGGGIYLTSRGVESVIAAPIDKVASATDRTFRHFDVRQTKSTVEEEGRQREVSGDAEDRDIDVTVNLKSEGATSTRVEVSARKSLVTWDKDFARAILEKIVAFSQ